MSSLVGIAVIALPSGIITAAVIEELRSEMGEQNGTKEPNESHELNESSGI